MIKFLNLKDQIIEGEPTFAFLDTITDRIMDFEGEQIFYNLQDFINAWKDDPEIDRGIHNLSRFTDKIPPMYFYKNNLPDATNQEASE